MKQLTIFDQLATYPEPTTPQIPRRKIPTQQILEFILSQRERLNSIYDRV